MRVYYGLDLLLSKLSTAQSNGKFREQNIYIFTDHIVQKHLLKVMRVLLEAMRMILEPRESACKESRVPFEAVSILEIESTFRGYNGDLRAKESACVGRESVCKGRENVCKVRESVCKGRESVCKVCESAYKGCKSACRGSKCACRSRESAIRGLETVAEA